jgi:hypothetical protein
VANRGHGFTGQSCGPVGRGQHAAQQVRRRGRPLLVEEAQGVGVLASLILSYQLPWEVWARFSAWPLIGVVIYFAHGPKHSLLNPDSPHHRRPVEPAAV